jgi:NAD(P)-dependent dehydrogenase (short-subunit alcohol dehydrogenase family)
MSSISAAFGNYGQADYAAANGIMNGLAMRLAAEWPAHVAAINWGPWDQAGMVSGGVRAQFLERGIQLISFEAGAEAIIGEIEEASGDPLVIVGDGPWTARAGDEAHPEHFAAVMRAAGV